MAWRRHPAAAGIFHCEPGSAEFEPLLSPGVRFASCYDYVSSGGGPLGEQARRMCARLKAADPAGLAFWAARVWEIHRDGAFASIFGADVVLVPVPGSGVRSRGPWVGERLAGCLAELGLAAAVCTALTRRHAVKKSAFAAAGERPSVRTHYDSFAIQGPGGKGSVSGSGQTGSGRSAAAVQLGISMNHLAPPRLVLVDDVITRGRTLLAAAARLRRAFPASDIGAFALLRTLEREEALQRNPDPREGWVRWQRGDAHRIP